MHIFIFDHKYYARRATHINLSKYVYVIPVCTCATYQNQHDTVLSVCFRNLLPFHVPIESLHEEIRFLPMQKQR